jgi:DNA-binding CsgD family transcriptional regulator
MATRIRWTETLIIEAINDWVARYGEVPARIDWDRPMSRRRGHVAKLARLQAHPRPVPTPTPVLARFGSWEAALAASGHRPRYATYRPNPTGRAETAALYASGLSIAKIAERLEVDRKTVRERLDRAGVQRRPPAKRQLPGCPRSRNERSWPGWLRVPARPSWLVSTGSRAARSKPSASVMASTADG